MSIDAAMLIMIAVAYSTMIIWTFVGLWMTHIYSGWMRILMSIFWPVALVDTAIKIYIECIQSLRGGK